MAVRRKSLAARLSRWAATLALLGAAAGGAWYLRRPPVIPIHVQQVKRMDIDDRVSSVGVGYVESSRRVAVQAETMARVKEVRVKRGERVHAGDVLVVLDDRDVRDQVRTMAASIPVLQARVAQAKVRATQLSDDLARVDQLHDAGVIPDQQRDQAKHGLELAELDRQVAAAAVDQARSNLDVARDALRKTTVRAPFDGVVLDVNVEVGDTAGSLTGIPATPTADGTARASAGGTAAMLAGMTSSQSSGVVDLADDTNMYVVADFDEADYYRIKTGQEATLTLDALGKRKMTGTVAEVFPYISRAMDQNRTSRVRILLPEQARGLVLAGMSASVEVKVGTHAAVLALPATCVVSRPGTKMVWRVDGGQVHETQVQAGINTWEWVEILSGVSEGQVIAVPPDDAKLTDGARIQVRQGP